MDLFKYSAMAISIHALREEGDLLRAEKRRRVSGISIHALREEGDDEAVSAARDDILFLSTPSARRATWTRSITR